MLAAFAFQIKMHEYARVLLQRAKLLMLLSMMTQSHAVISFTLIYLRSHYTLTKAFTIIYLLNHQTQKHQMKKKSNIHYFLMHGSLRLSEFVCV